MEMECVCVLGGREGEGRGGGWVCCFNMCFPNFFALGFPYSVI